VKIHVHIKRLNIYFTREINPGTAAMCADDFNSFATLPIKTRCPRSTLTRRIAGRRMLGTAIHQ